jgi:hypothetical protein
MILVFDVGDFNVDIDTVEERSGNAVAVALEFRGMHCAAAFTLDRRGMHYAVAHGQARSARRIECTARKR